MGARDLVRFRVDGQRNICANMASSRYVPSMFVRLLYAYLVLSRMQDSIGPFVSYDWLKIMYKLGSSVCICLTSRSDGFI